MEILKSLHGDGSRQDCLQTQKVQKNNSVKLVLPFKLKECWSVYLLAFSSSFSLSFIQPCSTAALLEDESESAFHSVGESLVLYDESPNKTELDGTKPLCEENTGSSITGCSWSLDTYRSTLLSGTNTLASTLSSLLILQCRQGFYCCICVKSSLVCTQNEHKLGV